MEELVEELLMEQELIKAMRLLKQNYDPNSPLRRVETETGEVINIYYDYDPYGELAITVSMRKKEEVNER